MKCRLRDPGESLVTHLLYTILCPKHTNTHTHTSRHWLCKLWSGARSGHLPRNKSLFVSSPAQSASLWVTAPPRAHCVYVHTHRKTPKLRLSSLYKDAGLLSSSFNILFSLSLLTFMDLFILFHCAHKNKDAEVPLEKKNICWVLVPDNLTPYVSTALQKRILSWISLWYQQ